MEHCQHLSGGGGAGRLRQQLSGLIQGWARHVRKSLRQWAARGVMALSGSCVTKYAGYWPNDHGAVCYKVVIKLEGAVRQIWTNERPDFSPANQSEASVNHPLDCNEVAGDRFRGTRSLSRIIRQPRSSAQQFYSRLRINKSPAWPGCLGWVTLTAHSSADCLIAALLHPGSRSLFLVNME